MIQGHVNARDEAVVRLRVRGPSGVEPDMDSIVDSGFNSSLALPLATVSALGLALVSGSSAVLADGSLCPINIYSAEVLWDGTWRPVLVSAVGDEPLLGMGLLAGHRLVMDVVPGGLVEILPIP